MNVNIYCTEAYENISDWTLSENKPNQTQFRLIFYNVLSTEMLSSVRSDSKSPIVSHITLIFCASSSVINVLTDADSIIIGRSPPKTADLGVKKAAKKV